MKVLHGLLQTTRFYKSFGVAVILSFLTSSIWYGIGALVFLLFSFAFNDWVDASKDTVGHPHRAIPSQKITKTQSLFFSILLLVFGVTYSFYFLHQYSIGFITIYSLSILYSLIIKPVLPIFATPIWSSAVAILFVQPLTDSLIPYIGTACVVYGYELLLDYRDRESDKQFCKTQTLANVLQEKTLPTALFVSTLGISILIFFYLKTLWASTIWLECLNDVKTCLVNESLCFPRITTTNN